MKSALRGVALAVAWSATAAVAVPEGGVALRLPAAPAWRGIPADAPDGSTAAMLYPAPTPLLGLVAVLTHGALVGGARSIEEKRRQEASDRVLQPYASALAAWPPRALAEASLPHLSGGAGHQVVESEGTASARWRVEAAPSFMMPAESDRLHLDARLKLQDSAGGGALPTEWQVRVVSHARSPSAAWPSDDDAAALKAESARLLAHAIDVALQAQALDAAALDSLPYKTHRYQDGGRERMERSQLLSATCSRLVLRTLRGTLLSVPARVQPAVAAAAEAEVASAPAAAAVPAATAATTTATTASTPAAPGCEAAPYALKLVDGVR